MAFFEFNIAMSGLFAAQRGLSVTSNNITNAGTAGYSRQQLSQKADTPLSGIGVGMLGTGVATTGISRVRDSYIDKKLWTQNAKLGEFNIKVTQNSIIEGVFGEPSDAGFTSVFNDMFNGLSELSKNPSSGEAKVALREQLISFTKYYNNISASLQDYQKDLNYELKAKVDEINNLGSRIQSLNNQIFQAEIYGDEANSFRDERDLCIDRLSELINVETKEEEMVVDGKVLKTLTVKVAGQTLVDHLKLRTLGIEVRGEREDKINNQVKEIANLGNQIAAIDEKLAEANLDPVANADLIITLENEKTALEAKRNDAREALKEYDANISIDDISGTITYRKDGEDIILFKDDAIVTSLDGKLNPQDADGLYDIVWKDGLSFDMTDNRMSGELKGLIDMRDGCGTKSDVTYNGIPYYIKRMDDYVRQFATTMNEAYSTDEEGYVAIKGLEDQGIAFMKRNNKGEITYYTVDADGKKQAVAGLTEAEQKLYADSFETKYQMFTYNDGSGKGNPDANAVVKGDYINMTSGNFSVSAEIYEDASNIRTTYGHDLETGENPNPSDGRFLAQLAGQKDNKYMFKEGDPKDYMASIFSELGISAQEAKMYQGTQTSVTNNIKNQRLSVSQVDTTEEFTNLIKYQQAYQAAAKVMNTIDGIYETTIFRLGNF